MTNETASILQELNELRQLILESNLLQKQVFDCNDAAQYLRISKSHLYQLTHKKIIRYYCPGGKTNYFKRADLDEYLLSNPISSVADDHNQVRQYLARRPKNDN